MTDTWLEGLTSAARPDLLQEFLERPYIRIALGLCIVLLWLRALYLLFFYAQKHHRTLLAYEDSRHFLPFVVAELYCEDYAQLRWAKLGALLRYFFLLSASFFFGVPALLRLLPAAREGAAAAAGLRLPGAFFAAPQGGPRLLALALGLGLLTLFLLERLARKLKRYYRGSSFYNQSAIAEAELDGGDGIAKGMRGEYYAWRLFQVLPKPRHILISPLVPKPNGSFAEIDLVALSPKGIFCVEAKNREGTFLPAHYTEGSAQWLHLQTGGDGRKARISSVQNPLEQNLKHIWTLSNFWHIRSDKFFNVLCFGSSADVKRALPGSTGGLKPEGSVLFFDQRHKLYEQVCRLPDLLDEALIERLYRELSENCRLSRKRREALLEERNAELRGRRRRMERQAKREGALRPSAGGGSAPSRRRRSRSSRGKKSGSDSSSKP